MKIDNDYYEEPVYIRKSGDISRDIETVRRDLTLSYCRLCALNALIKKTGAVSRIRGLEMGDNNTKEEHKKRAGMPASDAGTDRLSNGDTVVKELTESGGERIRYANDTAGMDGDKTSDISVKELKNDEDKRMKTVNGNEKAQGDKYADYERTVLEKLLLKAEELRMEVSRMYGYLCELKEELYYTEKILGGMRCYGR